jgi:membrane associated rhomboid family serine protease
MPPIPPITQALLLGCTAMFCLQWLLPLSWLALWPLGSGRFMPWQPFTYALLHADVWHLFFNMLGLWMFGAELEMLWGRRRYVQFLLASVLAAAVCQALIGLLMSGMAPTIGASGALYGLLIASAILFPNRVVMPLFPPIPMKQRTFVMVFGGLELLQGLTGFTGVAHFAHLGGMLGGWLMMQHWRRSSVRPWRR